MDKLKTGFESRISNNNYNSNNSYNYSNANTEELISNAKILEEEIRKVKNQSYEKDTMIETLKLQLDQQIKNNKNLDQLCESLKVQMKT